MESLAYEVRNVLLPGLQPVGDDLAAYAGKDGFPERGECAADNRE